MKNNFCDSPPERHGRKNRRGKFSEIFNVYTKELGYEYITITYIWFLRSGLVGGLLANVFHTRRPQAVQPMDREPHFNYFAISQR